MLNITIVIIVILALSFDFINGFHDTANTIATSVSTRVLSPKAAIIMAAIFNLIGALTNQKVAGAIAKDIVKNDMITLEIVIATLISAIIWNLLTWYFAIPSSSSHALFGSIIGASVVYTGGFEILKWTGIIRKILIPLVTAPVIGFILGYLLMIFLNSILQKATPEFVNKRFSKLQIVSAALMSYSHGSNDAQKSMGIITLALIASGTITQAHGTPFWVIVCCAVAMALGTSVGGWRIIKTVGGNIMKMKPIDGFAAQTGSALIIEIMTRLGNPVSTTQIITTSIMGVGASKRLSAVKWIVAEKMVTAWILTLPTTAVIGGILAFTIKTLF
ncbi:MAG: inorganic phosphate transporter [Clostridiales bacterium]|nr:inorganic phosphate transporter [Clostridiales bacterium]